MNAKTRLKRLEQSGLAQETVPSCVGIVGDPKSEAAYEAYRQKWAGRKAPYPGFIWIRFNRELPIKGK